MGRARAEVVAQGGPALVAMVEQDRAEVLLAAGLRDEGLEALRLASRQYGRRRLQQRRGEAELAVARASALHDMREARAAARRARELFGRERCTAVAGRAPRPRSCSRTWRWGVAPGGEPTTATGPNGWPRSSNISG